MGFRVVRNLTLECLDPLYYQYTSHMIDPLDQKVCTVTTLPSSGLMYTISLQGFRVWGLGFRVVRDLTLEGLDPLYCQYMSHTIDPLDPKLCTVTTLS